MIVARQGKPIHVNCPFVTRISPQRDADPAFDRTIVRIARSQSGRLRSHRGQERSQRRVGSSLAVWRILHRRFVKMRDLDRLHRGADGDFSNDCAGVRWAAERIGKLF